MSITCRNFYIVERFNVKENSSDVRGSCDKKKSKSYGLINGLNIKTVTAQQLLLIVFISKYFK